MEAEMKEVQLSTLGKGAAAEMFAEEWKKAMENIADVNTPAKSVREVSLTVRIYPREERDFADIEIQSASKLAKFKGFESRVHIGTVGGVIKAYEETVKQGKLPLDDKVTDIAQGRK
jgi:hypothetical protein